MKKLLITLFTFIAIASISLAHTARVNITIANTPFKKLNVWVHDPASNYNYFKNPAFSIILDNTGSSSYNFPISEPHFVSFFYNTDQSGNFKKTFELYLSPGDDIVIKADVKQENNVIEVTGKGSNNNQPLLSGIKEQNLRIFYNDTSPSRFIKAINKEAALRINIFEKYKNLYKPDSLFLKDWEENQKYYVAEKYYSFKEDNKFYIFKSYKNNYIKWQHVQDSLFTIKNLNNDKALNAYNYCLLIHDFLLREKEALWDLKETNPGKFYKEWYNSVSDGKISFKNDRKNLLKEKIINKFFSGKSAEYLYVVLFNEAINEANHENLKLIFERFKNQYPNSKYIAWFEPTINSIEEKQKQTINEKMIFAYNNGLHINNFEEVLQLTKGKTVLIDMWGTWCGPCLQEIEKNSQIIKKRFQDKELDYFYIANFDLKNEKKWKELIAYFHLEGTHILANEQLSKDIMDKVKGTGYPTYILIKKDGSYELSKAGYPMDREILIKQLEKAITQ